MGDPLPRSFVEAVAAGLFPRAPLHLGITGKALPMKQWRRWAYGRGSTFQTQAEVLLAPRLEADDE